MQWLWVAIFSLIAVSLTGFSIKSVFIYFFFSGLIAWLVRHFLIKNYEFDFEIIFNALEWLGYGTPHRIDRVKVASNQNDGIHTLTDIPRPIKRSLDKIISHILRDFVATWYDNVAKGNSFKEEAQRLLQMLSVEIYKRACDCDVQHLIEQVISIFHIHLKRYNNSVAVVKRRDTKLKLTISAGQFISSTYGSQITRRHVVLVNPALELSYLRIVIDTMLALLIKNDEYQCNIGRFLLREVLTVQTFKPLVDLMTDPDWICEAIVAVLEDSPVGVSLPVNDVEDSPTGVPKPGYDIEDSSTSPPGFDIEDSAIGVSKPGHSKIEDPPSLPSNSCNTSLENLKFSPTDINHSGKEKEGIGFENHLTEGNQDIFQERINNKRHYETNDSGKNSEVSEASFDKSLDKDLLGEVYTTGKRTNSIVSSHLSSSWSVIPHSRDKFFQTKSYEKLRNRSFLNEAQSGNLKHLKRLGSCCLTFETSSDFHTDDDSNHDKTIAEGHSTKKTLKSASLRRAQSASYAENFIDDKEISRKSTLRQSLSRSVSVPSSLSSYKITGRSLAIPDNSQVFENCSPFYSISIQSESDTYLTASSDEDFDDVEEVNETTFLDDGDVDHSFDVFAVVDVPVISYHSGTGHVPLQKQSSFEEYMQFSKGLPKDLQGVNKLPPVDNETEQQKSPVAGSQNGFDNNDFSVAHGKFYDGDYKKKFGKSHLLKYSKTSQSSSSTGTSSRDSDSFLGDTLTSAKENWKKLVSSINPPSVKFKFGDSKRSEEKQLTRNNINDGHLEAFSSEKSKKSISRSDALIDSDSDSEGSAGNCSNCNEYQHVYGAQSSVNNATLYAVDKGLIKIHPSCLINIPNTELLSEVDDRGPGRNKFTVYHIEYDVHIWPDVYQVAVYQSSGCEEGAEGKHNVDSSEHQDEVEYKQEKKARNLNCKRVVKRRYREFMELHNRLVHSEHCKEMKAILKPNRKFNMPFGRLEPSVVEGRRTILQYYLVSLVSNPSLRESQELKEFLGVMGDGLVSFVKPSVAQMVSQSVHVPRVDKMLNRQVTKLIDKMKTAFDAVDAEEDSSLRGQPLDKTFLTDSCVSMPWNLSCPEQHIGEDGTLLSTESCFDVFIDCQDFEIDDIPSTPTQLIQWDKSRTQADQQEKNYDIPIVPQLATLEADDVKEHFERHSQCDTSNKETLMEEDPQVSHVSSSARLCRSEEQLDQTPVEAENGMMSFLQGRKRLLGASVNLPSSGSPSVDKLSLPKISPTTVKEKLTSFANKSDDMWDGIKNNLTKRHSPRDSWELVRDNAKRVNNRSSSQELLSKPKEVDEVTEKFKNKHSYGWSNIKSSLIPKLKQDKALDTFTNFNVNQILKDRQEKKQGNSYLPHSESKNDLVSNESTRTDEFTVDHLIRPSQVQGDTPLTSSPADHPSQHLTGLTESAVNDDFQCPLASSILQLFCEVFRGYNSWVCRDYVQRAFMGVFGGIFEWWLQGELDDLVSEQKWGYYLKLLDKAIWPNGQLKDKQPEKADEVKMKTKKRAIRTLIEFFPGLFALSVGQKTYEECAENIIESLQYPEINRILLFELLELLLVEICPELQVKNSEIETV